MPRPDPQQKKTTELPLNEQVRQLLLEGIDQGRFPAGSRLPPERALAKQLGVGRVTLRTALGAARYVTFVGGDTRIAAAILPAEQGTWFFKMMGDDALTQSEIDTFMQFVEGVRKQRG